MEIAVVLLIVGFLLGGMMFTYSAQVDQSNRQDSQRRLELARELLISYAIVNGRLPCPATAASSTPSYTTPGDATTACTDYYYGYVPGSTIGFQPVDAAGFALDAWNNRLRYAVAQTIVSGATPHFTHSTNLKDNGVSTLPNDLVVCISATGALPSNVPPSCGTAASVANQQTLAAVIWTQGKNGPLSTAARADEDANNKSSAANNNGLFVYRTPTGVDSALGEFDDQMVWLPASLFYSRLITAGVLP